MCWKKQLLVENILLQMGKTWICHYEPASKNQFITYSLVKKKLRAQRSVKMVMLAFFLDMKEAIAIDFLKNVQLSIFNILGEIYHIY